MATNYIVLENQGGGRLQKLGEVETTNPEKAMEIVAGKQARDSDVEAVTYVAVPVRNWTEKTGGIEVTTKFTWK